MKRRSRLRRQRYLGLLSLVVVASMVCSTIVLIRPPRPSPQATPRPTRVIPTWTPTPRPSPSPSSTPATSKDRFTFAVCGDSRGGWEVYKKVLDSVQRDGCAFLIHMGDMVQNGTEQEFVEFAQFMSDFNTPFYPVPGNHDTPDGLLTAFLKHSGAPAPRYSFDYGPVHVSIIDTSSGSALGELAWLASDLDTTDQPIKVVALHYPPFDPAGTGHIMQTGNDDLMDLMREKGVRIVFAGHIHTYDQAERDGVRYIITGGAGAPLYATGNRPAYYHYVRATVEEEEITTEVVRIKE